MKSEHVEHFLPEYLEGTLEQDVCLQVKDHLRICIKCQKTLEQYQELERQFAQENMKEPSPGLKMSFQGMLQDEKKNQPRKLGSSLGAHVLKIAAGFILMLLSFQAGRLMEQPSSVEYTAITKNDNQDEKVIAMLSLLTEESASKRIQGVHYFQTTKEVDENILKVLINKMLYDENTNVRLAAVEALFKFSEKDQVRKGFLTALEAEEDPVIQILLIQQLAGSQEKEAVAPMKRLLQDEQTQTYVKEQIKALLPTII